MTAPDNPNPVPLAQKLWTVENHNDEWRLVCNGKIQEIDGLSVFQHHLEELAKVINASLAPKQEEREKITIRNLKLLDDIHRVVMRHSGNRELADSVWCLLRPDQEMAATAPPTQYKHLESKAPIASKAEDGLLKPKLREAWESGIRLARSYHDNIIFLEGEQKERQWEKFLSAHSYPPAIEPEPSDTERETLGEKEALLSEHFNVAGAPLISETPAPSTELEEIAQKLARQIITKWTYPEHDAAARDAKRLILTALTKASSLKKDLG